MLASPSFPTLGRVSKLSLLSLIGNVLLVVWLGVLVGVSILQNTVLVYGVSATWLLVGTGEMFVNDEQQTQNSSKQDPMVEKMLDTIRQQAEEIGRLKAENSQLHSRLEKSAVAANTNRTANAG